MTGPRISDMTLKAGLPASGAYVPVVIDGDPTNYRWPIAVTPQQFGAAADGVTDDYAAFAAAIAGLPSTGGQIFVPHGYYRLSAPLVFTKGIKLVGEGFHENPGTVGGTSYSAPYNWRGSVLIFDANVAGLQFIDFTDNNASATAFEYEGARFSVVEDLALWGGGGTTVTAHGIEARTVLEMRNVRVENFAGEGLRIQAWTSGAFPYGNASNSYFSHVKLRANKCHGAHLKGIDVSAVTFIGCDFANNGGAGVLDDTAIGGNAYVSCHFATNNTSNGLGTSATTQVQTDYAGLSDALVGSIVFTNVATTPHSVAYCYIEGGTGRKAHLPTGTFVAGGLAAQLVSGYLTATSSPAVIDASGILKFEFLQTWGGTFTVSDSNMAIAKTNSVCSLSLSPGSGTYSNIQLKGTGGLIANGLDLVGSGASGFLSADTIVHRNAAQSTTFNTADSTGFNINTGVLKVVGTQVVGPRSTGWTADTGSAKKTATAAYVVGSALTASAAYVQAEATAVITRQGLVEAALRDATQEIKAIKDALIAHGLIGT